MFGWWQWVSNEEHWLAQLGERRYAEWSALSERSRIQTPAGPTLRFCLYDDICKLLDFLVFSDKHENEKP